MLKIKTLTLVFSLIFFNVSWSEELDKNFLKTQLQSLQKDQAASGAFYPINCLDKAMTKKCYTDSSLFFTGLIAESLLETSDENAKEVKDKSLQYLSRQFQEQKGLIHYYETTGRLYKIVKADVDDNGIVLSILMNYPELADQKIISQKILELHKNSIITHKFFKKGSDKKESFEGKYLSTWVNPTKPFFNDIDLVVNFNGLSAFSKHNARSDDEQKVDMKPICSTVNQIIDWSEENDFEDLVSIRHWTKRRPENYSQWYPSKYAVMLAVVRAHQIAPDESCIKSSYQKVRTYLLSKDHQDGNIYDQALATAAYARIVRFEKLPKDKLASLILDLHERIENKQLGKNPFFFYGAVGYTASEPMLKALLIEATSILLNSERTPASSLLQENDFLEKLLAEQMDDGSFTALIIPSSPLYNIFVIFMYEYLGLTESKKEIVDKLVQHIFQQQKKNGAMAGYPDGPDHLGISTASYIAAKIAGVPEDDQRMINLEKKIQEMGGALKSDMITIPFFMMFSLFPIHSTYDTGLDRLMLKLDNKIPWIRVLLHPVLYLLDNGHNKVLSESKYPKKIFKQKYSKYAKRVGTPVLQKDTLFVDWALKNINPDGTFFDYTPTTVPMLMALSTFPEKQEIVDKGIKTLESFQTATPEGGLLQTPGEASIGETFYVGNVLLDVGLGHNHPVVEKAEKYLLDHQLKTGGWGFSKNSVKFADSDDTSNAMYFLIRLDQARNKPIRTEVYKALDWLLTLQNKNGGFGTWEKTNGVLGLLFNRVAKSKGLVMSESVFEHTARIVVCLSYLKSSDERASKAYTKAYNWLLSQQNRDGSFAGTWFINYLFSTSMAMTALSTDPEKGEKAIRKGISYLKKMQEPDGGFGESPDSFLEAKAISLGHSSLAQTGLIVSQLQTMNIFSQCKYHNELAPLLNTTHLYLKDEKNSWTQEMDPAWTAVTFPKVEYLIYPYIQRLVPWQAYNMYLQNTCR